MLALQWGFVAEALAAADLALGPNALAEIEQIVPLDAASGDRYHAQAMAGFDSERASRYASDTPDTALGFTVVVLLHGAVALAPDER